MNPLFLKLLNITIDDVLKETDYEKLKDWHQKILLEKVISTNKIERAKSNHKSGKHIDIQWFTKASNYSRILNVFYETVKIQIGKNKPTNERHLNSYFIDVAKEVLPPYQIEEIFEEAKSRFKSQTL